MSEQARVIAVYMNKGGVLKTTTAVNMASILALRGKRVLLIDADAQGQATYSFGYDPREIQVELGTILYNNLSGAEVKDGGYIIHVDLSETSTHNGIKHVENPGVLDLIPANQNLAGFVAQTPVTEDGATTRIAHLLDGLREDYDYIIFDLAPANDIILASVVASTDDDHLDFIVPAKLEPYSVHATEYVLSITDSLGINVRVILPTMAKMHTNTHQFFLDDIKRVADEHNITVTNTVIPDSIAFADSMARYRLPLNLIDDSSYKKQSQFYIDLVDELGY